jgi:hypothetical protein
MKNNLGRNNLMSSGTLNNKNSYQPTPPSNFFQSNTNIGPSPFNNQNNFVHPNNTNVSQLNLSQKPLIPNISPQLSLSTNTSSNNPMIPHLIPPHNLQRQQINLPNNNEFKLKNNV